MNKIFQPNEGPKYTKEKMENVQNDFMIANHPS